MASSNEIKILEAIKEAMGDHVEYFVISLDEVLVIEDDYCSYTFCFAPKESSNAEIIVTGGKHSLRFDIDEDGCIDLILGEDTQTAVTKENIYMQLYWHEVTEAI